MTSVTEQLARIGVVPVVVLDRSEDAPALGDALAAGGLPCAEVTFRTGAAQAAIRALTEAHPGMLVGAGTVLDVDQAAAAVDAGSRFVVSPGFDEVVVRWCLDNGVPVLPGVMTPSEIIAARRHGLDLLKFFPAAAGGGVGALQAFGSVFPDVSFMPTGGIGAENLADYLGLPNVAMCGGTWIAPRSLVAAGSFDEITRRASEAATIVRSVGP